MRRLAVAAALLGLSACAPGGCSGTVSPTPPAEPEGAASTPEPPAEPPAPEPVTWPHEPPGALHPGSGSGATDPTLWAAGMRFPLEAAPAWANSQVYGYGGWQAPGPGGQCDPRNYAYPWRDNFCETRSWSNSKCPAGRGHQGQDIRPATCQKKVHWAVAAEAGRISSIGSYTLTLLGDSGRIYRYLHLDMAEVNALFPTPASRTVTRGQRLGRVSDDFGGNATTIHLHFEIKAPVTDGETAAVIFVPTYTSLVDSYSRLLNAAA